jgi:hypothetical protein
MAFFTEEQLKDVLTQSLVGAPANLTNFMQQRQATGQDFTKMEVSPLVKKFLDSIVDKSQLPHMRVFDLFAGTGRNILEFVRLGVRYAEAVEPVIWPVNYLTGVIANLENQQLLPANQLAIIRDDPFRQLFANTERYPILICNGYLSTMTNHRRYMGVLELLKRKVEKNGYLILENVLGEVSASDLKVKWTPKGTGVGLLSWAFENEHWAVEHAEVIPVMLRSPHTGELEEQLMMQMIARQIKVPQAAVVN